MAQLTTCCLHCNRELIVHSYQSASCVAMDPLLRASSHPESETDLKREKEKLRLREVRSATNKNPETKRERSTNRDSQKDEKPKPEQSSAKRETWDDAEKRAQRNGETKPSKTPWKRIQVDTKVNAISPQVSKPRSVRPANRRSSEMVSHTEGLTLQNKRIDEPHEEMYQTNGAPPARLLPVKKISYVDQAGWRYWECDDVPSFRSAYADMLPSEDDASREQYISCFARPDPGAQFNTEESNTPFPGSRLVLTRVSDRAQVVCVVVESGHDLDHTDQSSRKTRCVLLRRAPAS